MASMPAASVKILVLQDKVPTCIVTGLRQEAIYLSKRMLLMLLVPMTVWVIFTSCKQCFLLLFIRMFTNKHPNIYRCLLPSLQVMGIKGASVLCLHPPFNFVKEMVVDTLHILFLGVVKSLLGFWFDKAHRKQRYCIRKKVGTCVSIELCYG